MNVSYSREQRREALKVYRRTGSVFKTILLLGYPGRWTLHKWIREAGKPVSKPKRAERLTHYPFNTKLSAVEMFNKGARPGQIASQLGLRSPMSVYSWVGRYRQEGEWGLMSRKERGQAAKLPTVKSLEASLPDDPQELKRLAAKLIVEKAVMNQELELIKKDVSVLPGALTNRHKAQVVDALRGNYPLVMLLDVVGVSSSSFYYQLHAMARRDKYCQLRKDIAAIAGESFHTYGYRRIWHVLRARGIRVSEKVVRKIISEDKILVRYPHRKRRYSSYNGEIAPAPENLVKRNFHANAPGKLWLTDITEFITAESKLYLSAIIDCFDGKVVGWATGRHPSNEIVMASMNMALEEPIDHKSLIIHSDRGTHYRGGDFAAFLRCHHITQSMSKKGCSPDNAACEGLFGRMKNEMYYGYKWKSTNELETAIKRYIHFYNNHRIKLTLGGITIKQYKNHYQAVV
ncbi:IS3 family transposase [uncultured Mobiluncus sp.]|uniref:IS3 family transposase n=1 Tax=uncultured Mobiluncus sp. TaxID=293425 RepID=UPI002636D106|nr:IS3 family transposase [uncultured Mobiluncus sp.]